MPKVKINDISMYYEIHGQGEPIVFIAGFSCDHTVWSLVVDILKVNYQVILFDNRGAGQTDAPVGPYSIEQMSLDVVSLCKELGINRAHFVGNSMGGFILQFLALHHSDLVKSAIISNSTMNANCAFNIYLAAQRQLLAANAPLSALVHAASSWTFSYRYLSLPGTLDQLIELGVNNPYPFTLSGYDGQYSALLAFDSSDWAYKIQAPLLVIAGDKDLIFSEQSERLLANQIMHSSFVCLQDCGHLPMLEYPEVFSRLVSDFVLQI